MRRLFFFRPMIKRLLEQHDGILPVLALFLATFFWGSSFLTISTTLEYTNPLTLMMMRFSIGAIFVGLMLGRGITRIPTSTWRAGAICGIVIYAAYSTNAIGLMTIESSMSGFLTALYVPLTPLLLWVVYGRTPSIGAFAGAMLAFVGLIFLANPFTLTFANNTGEWVTILSAFISAGEIIIVGKYAPGTQARQLAFTQLVSVAGIATIGVGLASLTDLPLKETTLNTTVLTGAVWLAVIVAFVQVLLSWAQRYVPAGRAAVIFAMESVFAAILGWFAGENLGLTGLLGGILIVSGILLGELRLTKKK